MLKNASGDGNYRLGKIKTSKKGKIKGSRNPSTGKQTFAVKSSAPLMIVVSSCVSSPPLPAYEGEKSSSILQKVKNQKEKMSMIHNSG